MSFIKSKTIDYAANAKQVYVDVASGSDVAEHGRGGVLQPYATIPAALAAIALAGPGNYVLCLAPGDYAGAPIAWPGNVSIKGAGGATTNISHDINYTSGAGTEVLIFEGVGLGNFTADLTLGGVTLLYIFNGAVTNFVRTDATTGAKLVQLINVNLNAYTISGNVFCYNTTMLSGGPYVVNTDGALSFQSALVPVPVTINGAGVLSMNGCTTSPGTVFTGVGGGTVVTDSSSLFGGASLAGTAVFSFSDDAANEKYTPAVPGDWAVPPTQVAQALDELAASSATIKSPATFVYQEGGVSGDNVYATWAEVMAAIAAAGVGPKQIMIDNSIMTPCTIPAGAYNLQSCKIVGRGQFGSSAVEFADGATITGNGFLGFEDLLTVTSISTSPIITATGTPTNITVRNRTTLRADGTAPIIDVPAATTLNLFVESGSVLLDGATDSVAESAVGGTINVTETGGAYSEPDAIGGGGTNTINRMGRNTQYTRTLDAGDIVNQYIDLPDLINEDSLNITWNYGLPVLETDDYTLSTVGGVTRLTFVPGGLLATFAAAGQKIQNKYLY